MPTDSGAAARWPDTVHAWGFSRRKLGFLRRFLHPARVVPVGAAARLPPGATLALWGSTPRPEGVPEAVPVLRFEDGFVRSVGLGADLVRPLSWVLDARGVHYDAAVPCDLELRLAEGVSDPARLQRAAVLRHALIGAGITKYNLGGRPWRRPPAATRVVLAVGQVESDAAVQAGAGPVRGNLALLRAVRAARPCAFVVYKPHPDVLAGLRSAGRDDALAAASCDALAADCDMAQLLDGVDEVHVITSLAGFEALLRGKPVTTYGVPFYAGWGLTDDRGMAPEVAARRTRRLSLDELVAVALIDYPLYLGLHSGAPATPEQVLRELQAWRAARGTVLPAWRRALRPLLGLAARLRGQ